MEELHSGYQEYMISDLRYQLFMATRRGRSMDREGAGSQRSWRDWPADPCYHPLFNYSGLPSIMDKQISSILYLALKRYLGPMSGGQ